MPNVCKVQIFIFFSIQTIGQRKLFIPKKQLMLFMKKIEDFIFEKNQCCSPFNAIGRHPTRPTMSTNKLFNTLYQTHNDITKVTWPKSTNIDHDISKLSKKKKIEF